MGLFTRKPQEPLVCPVCGEKVITRPDDKTGIGHFALHLEDTQGAGSPLRLACGCPEAVFDVYGSNMTREVMLHLRDRHHLKVTVL
jgi:hypothetical protein